MSRKENLEKYKKDAHNRRLGITEKKCKKCEEIKTIDNFNKNNGTKDGYLSSCKDCSKKYKKEYRKNNKEQIRNKQRIHYKNNKEKYKIKRREKYIKNKKIENKQNKERIEKYKKENPSYYKIEYQKYKDKRKKWRENNKEKIKEYNKEYFKNNKEYFKKKKKEYSSSKKGLETKRKWCNKYNKENNHVVTWRSLLQNTVKQLGTTKSGHTIDELGYSAEELRLNMISKFTTGMTWENHGEWHIDHIKPVNSFNKNEKPSVVCVLDNLQPLWATTREIDGIIYEGNLNKGKKYE